MVCVDVQLRRRSLMTEPQDHPPVPPQTPPDPQALTALARSMRVVKVWLAVLTVALGVFAAVVVVLEVGGDDPVEQADVGSLYTPTERQVTDAKAEVEKAYGDRLESVNVRIVRVDGGRRRGHGRGTAASPLHRVSAERVRNGGRRHDHGSLLHGRRRGPAADEGVTAEQDDRGAVRGFPRGVRRGHAGASRGREALRRLPRDAWAGDRRHCEERGTHLPHRRVVGGPRGSPGGRGHARL